MTTPVFTFWAALIGILILYAFAMGISRWHDYQDRKRTHKQVH